MKRTELPKKMGQFLSAATTDARGRVIFTDTLRRITGEVAGLARAEGLEEPDEAQGMDRDELVKLLIRETMEAYTPEERDGNCLRLMLRLERALETKRCNLCNGG